MKKQILLLFAALFFFALQLRSDEGMWLLSLADKNYEDMKKMGYRLSPEDIYSINQACLKDAVVGLGRDGAPFRHFCSGGIISDQGLIITNHHCAYGMIQSHSSLEHDYLKDGFWASEFDEELNNPGVTASVLIRMEDVSNQILPELNNDMTEKERNDKIKEISKGIIETATEDTYYDARVIDMFSNNQFFLFVHAIYKDVRIAGAPPSSMGKYGGDTDNWMWPRHTADFALLRVYSAPDGSPAAYSKENIPLTPKHFMPISARELNEGDFAMVLGFPGGTDRYMTSFALLETMEVVNTLRHDIRTVKLDVIREDMLKSDKVRIQYASKFSRVANYWKYSSEQNKALRSLNTMGIKKENEKRFLAWLNENTEHKDIYGEALNIIERVYQQRRELAETRMYMIEGLLSGPELPMFAFSQSSLLSALQSKDKEKIEQAIAKARESAESFYKDYNADTERKVIAAMFEYVYNNMNHDYLPEIFKTIEKSYKGDFDAFANKMFDKSIFATHESFIAFLDKPNAKKLDKDLAYITGNSVIYSYREVSAAYNEISADLTRGERLFAYGWMQINQDKQLYPDANSTIRLTYGTVGGYEPRDGVVYDYFTTIDGVMGKEDPSSHEFYLLDRFKDLYNAGDFGDYLNKDGDLIVNFISNNDITGGNSGSPVIDADGNYIGAAFDGNSEAMSGDIHFETELQKCINVDSRYILWVIDKYANAQNIMNELKIVR
jgi:hypothetical protein